MVVSGFLREQVVGMLFVWMPVLSTSHCGVLKCLTVE